MSLGGNAIEFALESVEDVRLMNLSDFEFTYLTLVRFGVSPNRIESLYLDAR